MGRNLKSIYDATVEAENAFNDRNQMLKDLQVTQVLPLVTDLINKVKTEPITEQTRKELVSSLTHIEAQLVLRAELRKKSSILKKTQKVLVRIQSLTFVELWEALDDQISSAEKVTLENLIHQLEDAIKQKNYAIMKELNEEVKRIFPAFCDLD